MRSTYVILTLAITAILVAGSALAAAAEEFKPRPAYTPSGTAAKGPAAVKPGAAPAAPGTGYRRPPDGEREEHHTRRAPTIFRELTDEDITDVLAFLGEHMPWVKEELEKTRQADPERFRMQCRRWRYEVAQMRGLQQRDPEAFRKAIEERQLRVRGQDLAAKARAAADPQEKAALVEQLRQVLQKQFDVEMVTRGANIRSLDERIESLRRELQERADHREDIVQRRINDMLGAPGDREKDRPKPKPPGEPKPKK